MLSFNFVSSSCLCQSSLVLKSLLIYCSGSSNLYCHTPLKISLDYTCSNNVAIVKLMLILVCIHTHRVFFSNTSCLKCITDLIYTPGMKAVIIRWPVLGVHFLCITKSELLGSISQDTKLKLISSRQLSHAFKEPALNIYYA